MSRSDSKNNGWLAPYRSRRPSRLCPRSEASLPDGHAKLACASLPNREAKCLIHPDGRLPAIAGRLPLTKPSQGTGASGPFPRSRDRDLRW